MVTKLFKVTGYDGHRIRISFEKSFKWDWSTPENARIIEVMCSDKLGTNDYIIVKITRNTLEECDAEMEGQETDGLLENERYGYVEPLKIYTADRETGTFVEEVASVEEGLALIRRYEEKDGEAVEFYCVVDEEHRIIA